MRMNIGRLAGGIAVAAAMLCSAQISSAQSLGADTIALFPKNVGEFAYANLKQARSQKWFPQLQEQMLPERFRQFEKFLASAGVDPNSQVEELAWGLIRKEKMYSLINEANGSGVVWAVLNPAYTRLAMKQLAPQIQQFPEAAKLVTRMQNLILNIQASGGIDGKFQAICGSTEDANTLAQLMQLAFVYQQYQAKQQNPELADLLGQAQVNPSGDRVVLRLALTDDQMTSLIKKNTFALKM